MNRTPQDTADIAALPGIKESDLRPCHFCGQPLGIFFYRIALEQAVVDTKAAQRQVGLGMMLGSAGLASVMGPNDDIAKIISTSRHLVCADCAVTLPIIAAHGEDG